MNTLQVIAYAAFKQTVFAIELIGFQVFINVHIPEHQVLVDGNRISVVYEIIKTKSPEMHLSFEFCSNILVAAPVV